MKAGFRFSSSVYDLRDGDRQEAAQSFSTSKHNTHVAIAFVFHELIHDKIAVRNDSGAFAVIMSGVPWT